MAKALGRGRAPPDGVDAAVIAAWLGTCPPAGPQLPATRFAPRLRSWQRSRGPTKSELPPFAHRGRSSDDRSGSAGHSRWLGDRKSTRLNSSHANISYAVFCLKKKKNNRKMN